VGTSLYCTSATRYVPSSAVASTSDLRSDENNLSFHLLDFHFYSMGRGIIDLSGKRFGNLCVGTLVSSGSAGAAWAARCDCGTNFVALSSNLRSGHTISCGCYRVQQSRLRATKYPTPGEYIKHLVLRAYQINAKNRGYGWELSDMRFFELILKSCHYCGLPPSNLKCQKGYSLKYGGLIAFLQKLHVLQQGTTFSSV